MKHVLVETNWVVDAFAPTPFRAPVARRLLESAARGTFCLHVPSICLREGAQTIRTRFQPKFPGILEHRRLLMEAGGMTPEENETVLKFIEGFRQSVLEDLRNLDRHLNELRTHPGVEVFPLSEAMLARVLDLRSVGEQTFDEAILAAILVRGEQFRDQGETDVAFATLDADLRPFDKEGRRKPSLADLYDGARVWVFSDFRLESPARPADW